MNGRYAVGRDVSVSPDAMRCAPRPPRGIAAFAAGDPVALAFDGSRSGQVFVARIIHNIDLVTARFEALTQSVAHALVSLSRAGFVLTGHQDHTRRELLCCSDCHPRGNPAESRHGTAYRRRRLARRRRRR